MAEFEGATIAHYKITSKLGQGGMGVVYCATDTKLDREVAIKVLPPAFAHDKERLARFEREAKVLAQLSHANIASVHGFDQSEGTWFLVMEHVDGEDLSQRLKRGPLPVDEAIEVGKQISEALEEAHAKGIIHRDLKPANIKLNAEGKVKVLDFGLAKALEVGRDSVEPPAQRESLGRSESVVPTARQSLSSPDDSPTITDVFTQPGTILGTAAYMSPEQAKGKSLDQRTDVWAFGCVLFEYLNGQRAFAGGDATETLAAIIKGEPDWAALPAATPLSVQHLLRKCLGKDRRQRLHEIADARIDLGIARSELSDPNVREFERKAKGLRVHPVLALASVVILIIVGIMLGRRSTPEPETQHLSIRKLNVELTKEGHLSLDSGNVIQLSPDGKTLGYIVMVGDERRLMLRKLDQLQAVELVQARGADQFCFSPDGQSIAFTGDAMAFLLTVPVSGGSTTEICEVRRPRGLDWADGWIYVALGRGNPISRVVETGGEPDRITELSEGEDTHRWPHVLPGGKAILYTSQFSAFKNAESKIMAQPLDGGEARLVRDRGYDARYLEETQSLIFF